MKKWKLLAWILIVMVWVTGIRMSARNKDDGNNRKLADAFTIALGMRTAKEITAGNVMMMR